MMATKNIQKDPKHADSYRNPAYQIIPPLGTTDTSLNPRGKDSDEQIDEEYVMDYFHHKIIMENF